MATVFQSIDHQAFESSSSNAHAPSFDTDVAQVLWYLTGFQRRVTQAALLLPADEVADYVDTRLAEVFEEAPACGGGGAFPHFWRACGRLVRARVEAALDQAPRADASAGVLQ